ncbi:MAG: flagellar hook-associated protein 3 FlgL [Clostridiales bacterium]|nr:flagellar hook-associated protein 3 FlgL [Clostridiales bacterium]
MRITNSMMINNMLRDMSANLNRLDKYQSQLATGRKIRVPSDDPVGASRSLRARTDLARNQQYAKNVDDVMSWLDMTESSLTELNSVLQRAKEITVQGANGPLADEDRQKVAQELEQLKQHVLQVGNNKYADRYIFAGTKTTAEPFASDGTYNGNDGAIEYNIGPANSIKVNITGNDVDITGIYNLLNTVQQGLEGDDSVNLSAQLGELEKKLDNVLEQRAAVGARANRAELVKNRLADDDITFNQLLANVEDVDIAAVSIKISEARFVYEASLLSASRIIQPSLADFLR